jgi:phosphoglycolate phosphatase
MKRKRLINQPMTYKAVIFDLDGTLLNTLHDIANPVNHVLSKYGYPTHSITDMREYIGNGIGQLVYRALPADVAESLHYKKILEEVRVEYQKHLNNSTVIYDGIGEVLSTLQARRISLNILSNKSDEFMDEVHDTYFKEWDFDIVLGARINKPLKPDPTSLLEIIDDLGLSADECVFVGDSDVDMQTAVNAGVYAVGVTWGFRTQDVLRASGADTIISQPDELLNLF